MAMKLNIHLNKQQQQALVAGVLFLGVGGFFYFKYFWAPISKRINDASAKIEDMDGKIEKAKSQAGRLSRIQKELEILNQQTADAERRLPRSRDVPAVIEALGRMARRNRIVLNSFAPGSPASKQFFVEVPYTISVSGTYHDIGHFFAAIALEERIFSVRNVSYASAGSGGKAGQLLTVSFTLIAYQYKG